MIFNCTVKKGSLITVPKPVLKQLGLKQGSKFWISLTECGFQLTPLSRLEIKEFKKARRRKIIYKD